MKYAVGDKLKATHNYHNGNWIRIFSSGSKYLIAAIINGDYYLMDDFGDERILDEFQMGLIFGRTKTDAFDDAMSVI